MLPGIPLSLFSLVLTIAGFVGGAVLWQILGSHSGIWERLRSESESANVKKMLTRQMTGVVVFTGLMIVLGLVLSETPLGGLFRMLSTAGGIIFWAYLGAMMVTAWRGAQVRK
jgi:hypothetical protein